MKKFLPLAVLLFAGCTVGPDYQKPDMAVPSSYRGLEGMPTAPAADLSHWWTSFNDAELESLIARAMQSNLDLMTAVSRVREARQQEVISGAAGLPQVNAIGDAAHLHSATSPLSALAGGNSSSGGTSSSSGSRALDAKFYTVGFDATWKSTFLAESGAASKRPMTVPTRRCGRCAMAKSPDGGNRRRLHGAARNPDAAGDPEQPDRASE